MNNQFQTIIEKFPEYMTNLLKTTPVHYSELKDIPKRGIYVYYENDNPIYVGRSQNLRQRLRQHRQQSSDHHSATFAFLIARRDAHKKGLQIKGTREELQNDPNFYQFFADAKLRIHNMKVQIFQIEDPIEQTLFEVYASLELKTEYNTWETH
ncbi:MAG: GIY-YIG nuclease family protein [Methanolinea sp.]